MEKLNEYQGFLGRLHQFRDNVKEKVSTLKNQENFVSLAAQTANDQLKGNSSADQDFSHLYRQKTRWELVRVSAAVMGIEFSYAAETAFVSPTLLQIGVEHKHMTLVWALSPLVGFFLCPFLGSMSDRCKLNMGRRRPFILLLSIGVLLGLMLVPNGEDLGYFFGDEPINFINITDDQTNISPHRTTSSKNEIVTTSKTSHPWGIFFTVLGTVLLDFDADACQSPARAYLLDVCVPEDHAKGLSTFTIMAGLGGFMGYSMGGINWDSTSLGKRLGGHVKAVFTIITFIFIACVTITITSFKEIPLWILAQPKKKHINQEINYGAFDECGEQSFKLQEDNLTSLDKDETLPNIMDTEFSAQEEHGTSQLQDPQDELNGISGEPAQTVESLSHYLLSIIYMPHSLKMLCLTNLFCWMAHVCYSLYFTDFVGEAVFLGDPRAPYGSPEQMRYEEGIRFGCFGMAMYSLSCSCYSLVIEHLIKQFKAKRVYVGGLLFYCVGMTLMALTKAKASVIVFSWAAGVMYSTLFTMPYLLVAHYHAMGIFEMNMDGSTKEGSGVRGLGTDIAIVSSMVFLAQFILSICMGTIVTVSGTTTAVVSTAALLSLCGAIAATRVMYLDL